ncbi:unnamed protein product [Cylicocyclus nassatus]|uniref:Uncharacterized protein n=1 Tax=Cylicocyclus nassatus TaxID=53992 RepID=A0AA36GKY7_CYLNA|nr:unnamed protein product [Cylicocyclus nassatus]
MGDTGVETKKKANRHIARCWCGVRRDSSQFRRCRGDIALETNILEILAAVGCLICTKLCRQVRSTPNCLLVSTRSTPSDMPPKQRSQRGSARKAPASKSSAEKGGEKQEGGAPGGGDGGSATDKISEYAIMILVAIQNACIAIQKFLYNLYLVIKFCWEKPDVAWDLISTTFHLIKVSRDAGLWSWSQLWDVSA